VLYTIVTTLYNPNTYKFFTVQPAERDQLQNLGVDGRIIINWAVKEIGWKAVDGIHLNPDREHW
jgi:hypothetical protein